MARTTSTKTADSLIDVLGEQVAREEAMLAKIQEAHGRGDANAVMKLVGEFFSGPGNEKGPSHGA
jgi:hypothetical protein